MIFERKKIQSLYKKLIFLYPAEFRERFGESMEQTFNDVCNEYKKERQTIPSGLVIWMFVETSAGIIKENLHEPHRFMNSIYLRIIFSITFGLLTTAPFFTLQSVYSNGFPIGIPWVVFNFLFVVAMIFCFLVLSLSRTPFKNPLKEWILPFLLKIIIAVPFVFAWTNMVSDQMPCFLGGRGC